MITPKLTHGITFTAGFTMACMLFFCVAAAAPDKLSQSNRYDAVFDYTGKALLLEIVDHHTNTAYIYNRMDQNTYKLKERIDLSQTGQQDIKVAEDQAKAQQGD